MVPEPSKSSVALKICAIFDPCWFVFPKISTVLKKKGIATKDLLKFWESFDEHVRVGLCNLTYAIKF
jgi:hypothetical protein